MKFKNGDVVKYISGNHGDEKSNPIWGGNYGQVRGTIIEITNGGNITVVWENGRSNGYDSSDLAFVTRQFAPHPYTKIFK